MNTQTIGVESNDPVEDALENAYDDVTSQFAKVGRDVATDLKDTEKVTQAIKQNPAIAKITKEGKINEAIGVTFLASIALAIPGIIRIIGIIVKLVEKSLGGKGKAGEAMIHWGHEKHHMILKYILKGLKFIPGFNKLDKKTQEQVSEVVHVIVVAYLALHSGSAATTAIQKGDLGLSGIEGALTAVKTGEVGTFLSTRLAVILGSEASAI